MTSVIPIWGVTGVKSKPRIWTNWPKTVSGLRSFTIRRVVALVGRLC
ncbi:UNVERIFIED_CONTAM: hypothetical protein GTU68_021663 [Idotea baltica]|nr:hypothetical protein [Idotea baltica]